MQFVSYRVVAKFLWDYLDIDYADGRGTTQSQHPSFGAVIGRSLSFQ
jgi:hypothetical protein